MRILKNLTVLFFIGCMLTTYAQDKNVKIIFEVEASTLSKNDSVFIAGNIPLLGNWQPGIVRMRFISGHLWEKTLEILAGNHLEYKFTRGTWATEASNKDGFPLMNSFLNVKNDTIVKYKLDYWRNGEELKVRGQITGHVEYYRQMRGEGILPRDVIVWLPPNYSDNPVMRFPVLYMHDGQNIIDPYSASFKVDWGVDETADSLIRAGEIKPLIIVGISSTTNRSADYSPGEKGEAYMKFLVYKLKPMIDSIYRTKPGRDNTVIGGASMGGLISFMLHWNYNDVFGKAICMSSAFQYEDFNYVNLIEKDTSKKDLKVYIDLGD